MAEPLSDWEIDVFYWEGDDPEHEVMPLEPRADGVKSCGQRAYAPDGNAWVCTRPADPPHRRHIAHYGSAFENSHDHATCVRMAWTGPISGG